MRQENQPYDSGEDECQICDVISGEEKHEGQYLWQEMIGLLGVHVGLLPDIFILRQKNRSVKAD